MTSMRIHCTCQGILKNLMRSHFSCPVLVYIFVRKEHAKDNVNDPGFFYLRRILFGYSAGGGGGRCKMFILTFIVFT